MDMCLIWPNNQTRMAEAKELFSNAKLNKNRRNRNTNKSETKQGAQNSELLLWYRQMAIFHRRVNNSISANTNNNYIMCQIMRIKYFNIQVLFKTHSHWFTSAFLVHMKYYYCSCRKATISYKKRCQSLKFGRGILYNKGNPAIELHNNYKMKTLKIPYLHPLLFFACTHCHVSTFFRCFLE